MMEYANTAFMQNVQFRDTLCPGYVLKGRKRSVVDCGRTCASDVIWSILRSCRIKPNNNNQCSGSANDIDNSNAINNNSITNNRRGFNNTNNSSNNDHFNHNPSSGDIPGAMCIERQLSLDSEYELYRLKVPVCGTH
ncbi:hypothetical protein DPMN_151939 [Dreissena polymorpha]|uniref:Uncharacterized protein n=1 Tax=Dreissena polymorpha TaxID=45954 RepID=A0A9D4FGK0_DREPO|nr:hypothetical protein DPMN_151939 [Dreissena polymorpha]